MQTSKCKRHAAARRHALFAFCILNFAFQTASSGTAAQQATRSAASAAVDVQKIVSTYCVTCHNDTLKTGGLALDRPELADVAAHADVWEKVVRKVRTGMMPPPGVPRLDAVERNALLRAAKSAVNAGLSVTGTGDTIRALAVRAR